VSCPIFYVIDLFFNSRDFLERFEFYFDDKERRRMLTVKFEPGTYRSFVQKKKVSLQEWKQRLLSQEERKQLADVPKGAVD